MAIRKELIYELMATSDGPYDQSGWACRKTQCSLRIRSASNRDAPSIGGTASLSGD